MTWAMGQRRRACLRWSLWLLILLWAAVVYRFSAQTGDASDRTSNGVIRFLLLWLDGSFAGLDPEAQLARIGVWSFFVRKLAHFSLYAALGVLAFGAFSLGRWPHRAYPLALGLGALLAAFDEAHQAFVPGRTAELRDVGIDLAGVALGAAALLLIVTVVSKRRQRKGSKST